MKLIMENWRKYLNEIQDPSSLADPCILYKASNVLDDLRNAIETEDEQDLAYRISQVVSMSNDIPEAFTDNFDFDAFLDRGLAPIEYDGFKKTIKGFMENSLDAVMSNNKDSKLDQDGIEASTMESFISTIYDYASRLDKMSKEKGIDFGADLEIMKSVPIDMAKELALMMQDYLASNKNPEDERTLKDQCRSSSKNNLQSEQTWCDKLKSIPNLIDYSRGDKRNFPLPWKKVRNDSGRLKYILALPKALKLNKSNVDIKLYGPIVDYHDCLQDHLSGDYPGRRSVYAKGKDEFEDLLSDYIRQGPQPGDYIYTEYWIDGKYIS